MEQSADGHRTTVVNVNAGKPWLTKFSGENAENYVIWRHQVVSLMESGHPVNEIFNAVRSSLLGQAAKILARMGTQVTLQDIVDQMDSIYGSVESKSDLLAAFFSARQGSNETVADWSCRLEETLDLIKRQGELPSDPNKMLRTMLWTGLRPDLKDISMYIYDRTEDFNKLRIELRRLEKQHPPVTTKTPAPCKPQQSAESEMTAAIKKLSNQLQQLTTDVTQMKKQMARKQNEPEPTPCHPSFSQESRAEGNVRPTGNSEYNQQSRSRMQCYRCGGFDHIAIGCRVRTDHLRNQDFPNKPLARGGR
jgi:hypothetical protein